MTIPKIIHQIWLGDAQMPPDLSATWREKHPDWQYTLWTDSNRPPLALESLWSTAPHPAFQSDLLRYELLHQYGGLYVDMDFECRRNVEPLLTGDLVMAYENPRHLQNGFIATTPGHPALKKIAETIMQRWQRGVPDSVVPGPILIDHLRRDPEFDRQITKIGPGLIGPDSPASYAVHRSLGSWHPSPQIIRRARSPSDREWGSHQPLLAGLWRRAPGEVVVEVGIGPYSTPFLVENSLSYTGIETDPSFIAWAGIQFRDDSHARFLPAYLPEGIPFHRGEATAAQIGTMDRTMASVAQHCPQKIDVLMVDCFGAARCSALKALASRATTVIVHDSECWDGYYYHPILECGVPWRHRFSLRPYGLPWSDAMTSYPVNAADIVRAIQDVTAPQFWPPGILYQVVTNDLR